MPLFGKHKDHKEHQKEHHKEDFDMRRAIKCFETASGEEGVLIDPFIDGYMEICKYLGCFGVVFSFTVSDIRDKLHILSDYRQSESKDSYVQVRTMLDFEVDNKLTVQKKKASGSRTLLRLQRALEFIALLVERLADAAPDAKASHIALEAYKETLSKHHEWLVRKAVQLGMRTLGHCGTLVDRIGGGSHEERVQMARELVAVLRPLDDRMHGFYAERDLLTLP